MLLALTLLSGFGKDLHLAWDSNTEPDLAGYRIYLFSGMGLLQIIPTSIPEVVLPNLVPGQTYSFYVTAFNSEGVESYPSETITYTVPVGITLHQSGSGVLQLIASGEPGKTYVIEASSDLRSGEWFVIAQGQPDSTGMMAVEDAFSFRARFYRFRELQNSGNTPGTFE